MRESTEKMKQHLSRTELLLDSDKILLALKFEAKSDFSNLVGKHCQFSDFMAEMFSTVPYFLSHPLRIRWAGLTAEFKGYAKMSKTQRESVANRAHELIRYSTFLQKLHFHQLSGEDSELVFAGMDLRSIKAYRLNLKNADFRNCDLRGAYFCYANLQNVNFSMANIDGAIFTRANLIGAIFEGCTRGNAIFDGAIRKESDYVKRFEERKPVSKYGISDVRGGCYHSGNHTSMSDGSTYY